MSVNLRERAQDFGQAVAITVKTMLPDWLKTEVFKMRSAITQDFAFVKKELQLARDVVIIDYNSLRGAIGNLNIILKSCCSSNNEKVFFGIQTNDENSFLWKALVKICCLKINMADKTVRVTRYLTIAQFWRLRAKLLREIQYKNLLEEHVDNGFELVDHDGNVIETSNGEQQQQQQDLPIPECLTVSSVLERVNEVTDYLDQDECLICMDCKVEISLPCAHSYCSKCINRWSDKNNTCPICRYRVDTSEEYWEFTDMPDVEQINKNVVALAAGT